MDSCASGATHGVLVAGSGGYKTESLTKPTMLIWTDSMVVNDPSGQVGYALWAARLAMGHRVAIIDPARPGLGAFNAFSGIDLADRLFDVRVREWVGRKDREQAQTGHDSFFADQGNNLLACILADLLTDPSAEKTPREWRRRIAIGEREMQSRLHDIADESISQMARQIANTLKKLADRTWSGVYSNAVQETNWLANDALATLVSGNTFNPTDVASGKTDVILQIPMHLQLAEPAVGRVILSSLLEVAHHLAWKHPANRVLFVVDEAWMFGKMKILQVTRNAGRKHRITLLTIWSSLGDLDSIWGKDERRSWLTNASWVAFAAVADFETAEEVSKRCGTYTVLTRSEGTSRSSQGFPFNLNGVSRGTTANVSEANVGSSNRKP